MKAKLIFDLDNPDDEIAHRRCIESLNMAIALFQILNNSWRNVNNVEEYQNRINDICQDIKLEDLIR